MGIEAFLRQLTKTGKKAGWKQTFLGGIISQNGDRPTVFVYKKMTGEDKPPREHARLGSELGLSEKELTQVENATKYPPDTPRNYGLYREMMTTLTPAPF